MPLNIDLNVPPYFDDYDEAKNYHRILFRPSVAVQARELTQAQTILQNQIERFGNWAFKSGDIVQGCTVSDIPVLPYAFLNDAGTDGTANNVAIDTREWVNCVAVSMTSNLQAKIIFANVGFQANYPNSNIIYLKYMNTGNGYLNASKTPIENSREKVFSNAELIQIVNVQAAGNTIVANVYSMANTGTIVPIGSGHGISVSEGIVFINGVFVKVETPTVGIVNPTTINAGNSVVGFNLNEQIVTGNEDSTLNDNALGYPNENAPGAHRLKLIPELVAYTNAAMAVANSKTFNAIAQYNYGSLVVKKDDNDLHSTVGTAIARRTFEESGNYILKPFVVDTITSASGIVPVTTANSVVGRISPGLGYAQGQRVEIEKTLYIDMRRGVDLETKTDQEITFNYGSYYKLKEVAGSFSFDATQRVDLYNTAQQAVSTKQYVWVNPSSGDKIGNAAVRMMTLDSGTPGSVDATYLLHVFDIKIDSHYTSNDVKSVYYSGSNKGVGDLAVTGLQQSSTKSQLYTFNRDLSVYNYKDKDLNNHAKYIYRKRITGKTMSSSGVISVADALTSSYSGGTDLLPYGTGYVPSVDSSSFTVVAGANAVSAALTGSVAVSDTNTYITAAGGGNFNNFAVGDIIQVKINGSDVNQRIVTQVIDSTHIYVDTPFASANGSAEYRFCLIKGKEIPLNRSLASVNIVNSTEFTISTGISLTASTTVDIIFDVKRTQVVPAKKEIRKGRYVKINTADNPRGPWCLGFSDVHKINKIYAKSGSYPTSTSDGIDVTNHFLFDNGQKDTHYDLGYLYNINHDTIGYSYLLIELDYFVANTSSGIGFFTINSYPIDDVNPANTTAIQSKDLPLYISENGERIALKSYVDYRTPSAPTVTDTTTISSASVSPISSTLSLNANWNLYSPAYGKNFTSDVTYYLPRKDLVMITGDNIVKVKEGLSSLSPKAPLSPDNAMPIAIIDIPAYPSLSTDQLDSLLSLNRSSKTLIRDTGSSIATTLVSNRGYTMRDIAKLDQRISDLEYYTQLTLLEKKAADMQVTDINGINRYKNGIFVDNFSTYVNQLPSDPDYRLAIDPQKGVGRPYISQKYLKVTYNDNSSSNVQKTGQFITLPYTSEKFIEQPNANVYRNAALVASQWNGTVRLYPSVDNRYNLWDTGSMGITVDNTKPFKDFANSPMGSNYGAWRTTTSSETSTVKTGTRNIVTKNIGIDIGFAWPEPKDHIPSRQEIYDLLVANGENPPQDFIIGSTSTLYNGGYNPIAGTGGVATWFHSQSAIKNPGVWGPGTWGGSPPQPAWVDNDMPPN